MLTRFVAEALELRPEVRQSRALVEAEGQRAPQAGAFPDPVLTFGLQNDGFTKIQIGQMETSWVTLMASQTVPWFGKRGLRAEVASLGARQAQADAQRVTLSVRADLERAYVDLLLARDQLGLLTRLESLWQLSEGLARTRYEAGEGAQSDLLRAQLERGRLTQRRWALEAEERRRATALNRLRGRPLDEPVVTTRSLVDLPDPAVDVTLEATDLEALSPEVCKARLSVEQSAKRVELARRDSFSDPTVSAGVMPRGKLEPMWLLGVSFSLPVWAASRQSAAVSENELRASAAAEGERALRGLLRQRVRERRLLLEAQVRSNHLYRVGLLVQSESTVTSTIAQYQVGQVMFASVLEALAGYLADVNGFLESVAAAQRLETAQRELSLEPAGGASAGGMGAGVPGAGNAGAGPASFAEPGGTSSPGM